MPPPVSATAIPLVRKSPSGGAVGSGAEGASTLLGASTQEKLSLAQAAMRLRDEQVSARVVYFGPEQRTNAELDAITEAVVAELAQIRSVRQSQRPEVSAQPSPADREIDLIAVLRRSLELVLDPRRGTFLRVKLAALSRRVTKLFFAAALGHNATPEALASRSIATPEQAVYYAVARSRAKIVADLGSLRYESTEVRDAAIERLDKLERDLQMAFLSREAPELEKVLSILIEVFTEFFHDTFRQNLGEFCWAVVRESAVTRAGDPSGGMPKIGPRGFSKFRECFERQFLQVLVLNVQEPLVKRVRDAGQSFRRETLGFVSDPRVFSVVCSVMCDAFYDHLHSEGLLDLPARWRAGEDEG